MINSVIGRLRLVGLIEGVSFILLLGVAMPLKYAYGQPLAVRIVGAIHGILFLAYVSVLIHAAWSRHWRLARVFVLFLASVIPFGIFIADKSLRREQAAASG